MRILLVVHGYPPEKVGGTETYTRSLAYGLKRENDVAVFSRTATEGKEYELVRREENGLPIWLMRNTYSLHADYELNYLNPHIEEAFVRALDEFKPDVVHFTYLLGGLSASYLGMASDRNLRTIVTLTDFHFICPWGQLLTPGGQDCPGPEEGLRCSICFAGEDPYAGLSWWRKMRIKRLPIEKQVRRLKSPGLTRMRNRISYLREMLRRADVIISPTKYLQEVYKQWGIASIWLPFGIDKSLFSGFKRKRSQWLRLGFIGRLLPLKGLHVLVEALAGLPGNVPPWKLYVYADESGLEEKRYLDRIKEKTPATVEFRGTFPPEEIKGVYEDMDVLVLPSLWAENSPMVLLYALHTNTPVVAADIGGVREIVGASGACLYSPRDVSSLQGLLSEIFVNPGALARLKPVEVSGMDDHVQKLTGIYRGESA